jgi:glucose-6-phosphate dehydrogenase assembly protein OpcA
VTLPRLGDTLARVDAELRALAGPPAPGQPARARACTMNLVVVAPTPERATGWLPVVDEVLQALPARAIVVGLDPDGQDSLEAGTSAICTPGDSGSPIVCSERVTLVAHGAVCARLPSCVSALCSADVPTTLVWLGRVHTDDPAFEPLARDASRIVLDASEGSLGSLASVVYWARARADRDRPGVADLAWTRLAAWQEMSARFFDEPRLRTLARQVPRVTLAQASPRGTPPGPEATLMLGWLATSLGWRLSSLAGKLRLVRSGPAAGGASGQRDAGDGFVQASLRAEPDARTARDALVSVCLEASAGDLSMRGEITREPGDADAATWRLDVSSAGVTQRIEQHVRLRASGPAGLLERTLHRPANDPALAEAAAWADELRSEELTCS